MVRSNPLVHSDVHHPLVACSIGSHRCGVAALRRDGTCQDAAGRIIKSVDLSANV